MALGRGEKFKACFIVCEDSVIQLIEVGRRELDFSLFVDIWPPMQMASSVLTFLGEPQKSYIREGC